MKNKNETCDTCNGHISYDFDYQVYRCDSCGTITDSEGYVVYDVQTMS